MSAIKNYIYDKCIELAKELQYSSVIDKAAIRENSYIPKKYKAYDPILADDIHDMVTTYMVDEGMTLAQALDEVKIKYMVANQHHT